MKVLVTGAAGFIGFHLTQSLLKRGDNVIGIDNINDYYDINLKFGRLNALGVDNGSVEWNERIVSNKYHSFQFIKMNLEDKSSLDLLFKEECFDVVCNLAAQAGVRYSILNPEAYINSNIIGFLNILEACRHYPVKHLVYASSSSVYGLNERVPFSEKDSIAHPVSLYAASKKSNELMAHAYSHLYNIPTTGLRFFTVYGPWGRPDMAPFLFAKAILSGDTISVFNNGEMQRDFTYIDDIILGIQKVIDKPASSDLSWSGKHPFPDRSSAPYRVYNIGNSNPIKLMDFIKSIEQATGFLAKKEFLPMQPGDVKQTNADTNSLENDFKFKPSTNLQEGVDKTIDWFTKFYKY